ncbi:MAG: protein kinase [Planctomycetes bacterium]|nr:protein kinase [Planctomycetota bacterium]
MASVRQGDRISNYLLEARVGAGTFGEVWRAKHHVFNDIVAIKIPTDPQYVRNLQREGTVVHGLRHPNIVRALDMDPYADPPYLVMEYVDGPPLRAAIDQYKANFPISAVVAIMRGTLNGLAAAHGAGLIHRDLKPENILLAEPLSNLGKIAEQSVKVTDFGLGAANGATANAMLQSGSLDAAEANKLSGTIAYMSPEQRDGEPIDGRSDLYSCGILLFEMLTGERPQGTELPSALRRGLPTQFDEVFRRAYTRKDRRFGSAAEMAGALSGVAGPKGVNSVPIDASRAASCPSCAKPVHRDDQFCIHCGRQLTTVVPRCRSCDAYVHPSDRFCIACGKDLGVLA